MLRTVVASLVSLVLTSLVIADDGPFDLRFEPVSDGVILAYRPDVVRYPVIGNAVIIPSRDGVVLVDGGGAAAVVDQIVRKIESLDSGPLVEVIITHWHDDHTVCLDRYRNTFPNVRIVAHPHTRERLVNKVQPRVGTSAERFEEFLDSAREQLKTGTDADSGEPLTPVQIDRARQIDEDAGAILAQRELDSLAIPDVTTEGGLVLRLGERVIEIHHLGPGNTMGDLVVWLPKERILIGGDIVTWPVPFGFPRLAGEVINATEKLLEFDFASFIPGHGPVFHDDDYARRVLALQKHAVAEIRGMSNLRMSNDEIREKLDLSPYDIAITGNDPKTSHFLQIWYIDPIIFNASRELY